MPTPRRPCRLPLQPPPDIPVLGTSVTDYATALEIADWTGTVGGNISGTSDLAPLDQQAAMLKELFPEAKMWAFCIARPRQTPVYQVEVITGHLQELGYTCTSYAFTDSNDVAAVTQTACDSSDVIYIPTDNTAASNTEAIANVVLPAKVPVVAGEAGICGGLRRSHPVHRLLRSGLYHRPDGCKDPDRRGGRCLHACRLHPM